MDFMKIVAAEVKRKTRELQWRQIEENLGTGPLTEEQRKELTAIILWEVPDAKSPT